MNNNKMKVEKRNGKKVAVSYDKVLYRIRKLANDKSLGILKNIEPDRIAQDTISRITDGIKTSELDEIAATLSIGKSIDNPEYAQLASRIIISNMHKNTTECFSDSMETLYNNVTEENQSVPLIHDSVIDLIRKNKETLNFAIDYSRDYLFDYFGYKTLERSYLIKVYCPDTKTFKVVERPQHMWLRVALGIHKTDVNKAIETYNLMSLFYFIHASPTLFNSGTPRPACSSCFLLGIEDSMPGIYKCLSDCAGISKHAGGIGIHVSNIRAKGSYIKGTNGRSDGLVKMLKVFNETAKFANQGSKRNGSFAVYLEPFHADIYEFLELRKNTGEENHRARDLFYALWISDTFMNAVEKDQDWYLMSPDTCPGLTDAYGEEYDKLYYSYVKEGKYRKVVKARDLWQRILISQIETGMPYMSYKDAVNIKCNQKNIGTVKSSNLCVSPDTYILTDNGYHQISDLENQEVNVWNGFQFSKTKVLKTGTNQEMLNIEFSNGSKLCCTKYHKFHIKNDARGVIEAQNLVSGMKLIGHPFPIINSKNTEYQLPYYSGLNFTHKMDATKIPINFSIDIKLKWFEGFIDSLETVSVNNDHSVTIYKKDFMYFKTIWMMLHTLGCNPSVTTNSLILYHSDIKNLYSLGFRSKFDLLLDYSTKSEIEISIVSVSPSTELSDTYCFNEPINHTGIFNGIIAGNCNEITLVSDTEETAVCNICTFSLPKYLEKNEDGKLEFNHKKLYDVVKIATKNMNNIIDYNFYPTPETKKSNLLHRPIAMGIQGLANLFFEMSLPFESEEAKKLNKEIMETIQYSGWTASMELAKESGTYYKFFPGSPISQGLFQHNLWGIEDSELSCRWDWEYLRKNIKEYGVLNSMITALPPTASTSQILGNYESFEPQNANMFMRSTLSGDFPIVNKYLFNDLNSLGLWNDKMKENIKANRGSIQNIPEIPQNIKNIYKTIWEIPQKHLIDMSRDRALFVDQTQSLNIYMDKPTMAKLSSMHFYGWKQGLKTGMYYLRSKPASTAQQFTVSKELINTTKQSNEKEEEILLCSLDNRDSCMSCSG
jgi:ribonucleoside-diphosphate reductase alpha chain